MADDCVIVAKYDYKAQSPQELDIKKNEKLTLLDDTKQWWKVENSRGRCGYVPSNYVRKEKPSILNSIKRKVKKNSTASSVGPLSQLATLSQLAPCSSSVSGSKTLPSPGVTGDSPSPMRRPPPPVPTEDGLGTAIVKYNYQAQQGDELPLVKGARIQILEKSNDGWWRGQYNGQ
ncbi:unnamed protein product, partial [Cyprideis torosa]